MASTPSLPSSGHRERKRKITREDVDVVQNLIEGCLKEYLTRDEAVNILVNRAKIEPLFIIIVWQKLQEENPEFFTVYNVYSSLRKQIALFNQLLVKQSHLMYRDYNNAMHPSLHNGPCNMPDKKIKNPGVASQLGGANSPSAYPAQHPYLPTMESTDAVLGYPAQHPYRQTMDATDAVLRYPAQHPYRQTMDATDAVLGCHTQHPYLPTMDATNAQSSCYGSSYHVTNGFPAVDNIYPIQQNVCAASDNQVMAIRSYGQSSLEPNEIQRFSLQPMTSVAVSPPNMCFTEGLQLLLADDHRNSLDNFSSHCNPTNSTNIQDFAVLQSNQSFHSTLTGIVDTMEESASEYDIVDYSFIVDSASPPCSGTQMPNDEKNRSWGDDYCIDHLTHSHRTYKSKR